MRIAICISHNEFKFYDLPETVLAEFKKKHAEANWRIVDLENCKTKAEAEALCRKTLKDRITRIKYIGVKKKYKSGNKTTKRDTRAYRLVGSAKQYANLCRKFDATKIRETRIF